MMTHIHRLSRKFPERDDLSAAEYRLRITVIYINGIHLPEKSFIKLVQVLNQADHLFALINTITGGTGN